MTLTTLLDQYQGVIYSELKKMHIYPGSQDYDDYFQLACIKLFETYKTCNCDALLEENRYRFVNYASQSIRWAFLDQKRRDRHLGDHEEQSDDIVVAVETGFEDEIAFIENYHQLMDQLTIKEQRFLYDRFYLNLTMTDIAKKHGVSRKTIHLWRQGLQEKAQFLKKG